MGGILDKLDEWLRGLLIEGITGNLSGMFDTVNTKVGEIAGEVGQTPLAWNSGVFSMIRNLSETVIVPIAGVILTFVMCYELIQLVTEKNNLHDVDTWMFFKWIFKTFCAVLIVTNTWNIVMGIFDVGQSVVNSSAGVIIGNTSIDISSVITDYDCYVDGLYSKLGEYENLDELNYLASKLDEMDQSDYARFQAGMEMGDHCGSLQEIINLTENLDCYEIYPNIEDYDDLGRYYIEELDVMQVPEQLQNYIDYEAYGRDVALEENGTFTDQGYVRDTGDSFHEYYDGERGSIPDEYRVMTFQDDLPEEEKSEWAMDIAFDMDEFFRQLLR